MFDELQLTGRVRTHVVQLEEPRFAAHPDAVGAFLSLRQAAAREGIDLRPFSAFRDFKAQLRIWNKKFLGRTPLYDRQGAVLSSKGWDEGRIVDAILAWSGLPGGSRHHWGTEIDVFDRAAVPKDYRLRMLPEEVAPGGAFYDLHRWLGENMANFGFFRPYAEFRGGMFPEPWHLSFAPLSLPAMELLRPEMLVRAMGAAPMLGKASVLARLDEIFEVHLRNISPAP